MLSWQRKEYSPVRKYLMGQFDEMRSPRRLWERNHEISLPFKSLILAAVLRIHTDGQDENRKYCCINIRMDGVWSYSELRGFFHQKSPFGSSPADGKGRETHLIALLGSSDCRWPVNLGKMRGRSPNFSHKKFCYEGIFQKAILDFLLLCKTPSKS